MTVISIASQPIGPTVAGTPDDGIGLSSFAASRKNHYAKDAITSRLPNEMPILQDSPSTGISVFR